MFPGEFFLLTVIAVMTFHIITLHRRLARIERAQWQLPAAVAPLPANAEQVSKLEQRIHVLERIATDREGSVARDIEELRDR